MKKVIIIIASVLAVAAAGTAGYFYLTSAMAAEKEAAVAELQAELDAYKETYDGVGEITLAYTLADDKAYGEVIEESDLTEYLTTYSDNLIFAPEDVIGKICRVNITAGTPLTSDVLMDYEVSDGERAFDVITDYNAVGLKPNDFVDIRFVTPMGEDYIALSHRRVEGVYDKVLKLAMSEYDIMVYNSLQVDKVLMDGSMIYTTKYIVPGGQEAAETFYPFSSEVLSAMSRDPNIKESIDYAGLSDSRARMLLRYQEYSGDEYITNILAAGKRELASLVQSGQSAFVEQEERAKAEKLEAEQAAAGY